MLCCTHETALYSWRMIVVLRQQNFFETAAAEVYVILKQQDFWKEQLWNVCYFRTTRLLNKEASEMYVVHEQQNLINHAIFVCFITIITNLFDQTEKTFSDHFHFIQFWKQHVKSKKSCCFRTTMKLRIKNKKQCCFRTIKKLKIRKLLKSTSIKIDISQRTLCDQIEAYWQACQYDDQKIIQCSHMIRLKHIDKLVNMIIQSLLSQMSSLTEWLV